MTDSHGFDLHDFNKYGVLAVNFIMVLALAFLVRHYWLGLAALMSRSADVMNMVINKTLEFHLVAEIPALLVVIAAIKRKPAAGKLVRAVWRAGLPLLAVSMVGSALLLAQATPVGFRFERAGPQEVVELLLTAASAGYLFGSRRSRHTFAEFPAPPPPEA